MLVLVTTVMRAECTVKYCSVQSDLRAVPNAPDIACSRLLSIGYVHVMYKLSQLLLPTT